MVQNVGERYAKHVPAATGDSAAARNVFRIITGLHRTRIYRDFINGSGPGACLTHGRRPQQAQRRVGEVRDASRSTEVGREAGGRNAALRRRDSRQCSRPGGRGTGAVAAALLWSSVAAGLTIGFSFLARRVCADARARAIRARRGGRRLSVGLRVRRLRAQRAVHREHARAGDSAPSQARRETFKKMMRLWGCCSSAISSARRSSRSSCSARDSRGGRQDASRAHGDAEHVGRLRAHVHARRSWRAG